MEKIDSLKVVLGLLTAVISLLAVVAGLFRLKRKPNHELEPGGKLYGSRNVTMTSGRDSNFTDNSQNLSRND
jgi:hypothetical protein